MCDVGSAEMPRLITETMPKARKKHICCECGSVITPGEKYEKISGLWDKFETYKTCLFCAEVRQQAHSEFDLNLDEGFVFGQLWECVGYDYV